MLCAARGLPRPDVGTESELASETAVSRGLWREVSQQHGDVGPGGGTEVEGEPSEPAGATLNPKLRICPRRNSKIQ